MLWNKLRYLAAAALAVGIASGGAGVYVLGSQDPGAKSGKDGPKPSAPASASAPAAGSKRPTEQAAAAELRAQQIATRKARAAYEIARLTRELAEIAVEEYEVVGFPRDLAAARAATALAEADLTRDSDRADWAERMFKKGYVSQAQKASQDLSLKKARLALEQAQASSKVLVEYTRSKKIKELRSAVEKARLDELDRQAAYEAATIKEKKLKERLQPKAK